MTSGDDALVKEDMYRFLRSVISATCADLVLRLSDDDSTGSSRGILHSYAGLCAVIGLTLDHNERPMVTSGIQTV